MRKCSYPMPKMLEQMMFRAVVASLLSIAAAACSENGPVTTPTGPTRQILSTSEPFDDSPRFTRLDGGVTYSGSATKWVPTLEGSLTCPTSTSVRRDGNRVVIAPLLLEGECHNLGMPVGELSIDATGNIQLPNSGIYRVSCGTYTYMTMGRLTERELHLSISATSQTCPDFTMTATLSR